MTLPYEKFLIYRSLRGDTVDQINAWLQRYCLPLIDNESFLAIKDKVKALCIPRGYKTLYNRGSKLNVPVPAMDYLTFHGLDKIFAYEESLKDYLKEEEISAMEGALAIHRTPFVRLVLHALLFHNRPNAEMIELIKRGHGQELTADAIAVYREFFFEPKHMYPDDWNKYLKGLQSKEREIIYAALTNKLDDIVYLLRIPSSVEYVDFLKSAMNTAHYKFNYYSSLNTSTGDKNARAWANTGINSGERYEKAKETDNTDIFKQFQIEFDHQDITIPVATPEIAATVKMDDRKQDEKKSEEAVAKLDAPPSVDPENF